MSLKGTSDKATEVASCVWEGIRLADNRSLLYVGKAWSSLGASPAPLHPPSSRRSVLGLCRRCCSCWLERQGSSLKYADIINGWFIFMCWLSPASAAGSRTRVRSWRFQPTTIWFSQFRNVSGSHWKITSGICSGNQSLVKERQIIYMSIPLYTLTCILNITICSH